MRKQLPRVLAFALLVMALGSSSLMAQDEAEKLDARLLGYPEQYMLPAPGTAGAWATLAGLGILCLGPLFLNAKRTHLD
jgi:hypothetical protein